MTEPIDLSGIAEAARMLDDQTQQLMPVPMWLDETAGNALTRVPPTVPFVTNPTAATAETGVYGQAGRGTVSAYFRSDW